MTRAIVVPFHKYTPFGDSYYEPLFDFYLSQLKKFEKEYDKVYFLDSTWNFTDDDYERMKLVKGGIIKVDPSLRYYDAYKSVLPMIKETAVLFTDNDFIIYKPKMIEDAFAFLDDGYQVVSIYDTIGTMKVDLPDGKNKFCPYWFCTRKEFLMKYLDVDWGPDAMPYTETFGLLTEAMLKDKLKPYEYEEDKNSIYYDGAKDEKKNLGYYHIRSGSVPAYLLATKKYGNFDTYWKYINEQPKREYLRQSFWYNVMGGDPSQIVIDSGVSLDEWDQYVIKAKKFHGLSDN
jgi:hypothetical protein